MGHLNLQPGIYFRLFLRCKVQSTPLPRILVHERPSFPLVSIAPRDRIRYIFHMGNSNDPREVETFLLTLEYGSVFEAFSYLQASSPFAAADIFIRHHEHHRSKFK